MQVKIFNVPIADNGEMLAEMNKFLATHKVLEMEQNFYQAQNGACWCFCVKYLPTQAPEVFPPFPSKDKIDYRAILGEKEFAVFSKLRVCRKELAAETGIPPYGIFTDFELSEMTKLPELTAEKLVSIRGIGDKKMEKFGRKLLEMYYKNENESQKTEDITENKEIG